MNSPPSVDLDEQDDANFEECLSHFRANVTLAVRCFFAERSINYLAAADKKVLTRLNDEPYIWTVIQESCQTTVFITLGRIFDLNSNSKFTLRRLLALCEKDDFAVFQKSRLEKRKRRSSSSPDDWIDSFILKAYVPTRADFCNATKIIDNYREIYNKKLKPLRDKVFAHADASSDQLFQLSRNVKFVELRRVIRILQILDVAIWQLYHNGRDPRTYKHQTSTYVGQIIGQNHRRQISSDQEFVGHDVRSLIEKLLSPDAIVLP